jgi:predicted permease
MEAALDNLVRLLTLGFPVMVGAVAGWLGVFSEPRRAVDILNRYALTFGFPALIVRGLIEAGEIPSAPAFWLSWPVALGAILLGIRVLVRSQLAGTVALTSCFGNVAFLGLPYVLSLYGSAAEGFAALAVSIHVAFAATLGPILLVRWGSTGSVSWRQAMVQVMKMPLVWSPFVGLALGQLPESAQQPITSCIGPIAASAAPVALFLLGLYLFLERGYLRRFSASLALHVVIRLLVAPTAVALLVLAVVELGWLEPLHARIHIMLASMPAAITAFSLSHRANLGQERVAATVVWSSALALLLLPLWAWIAGSLL